MSLSTSAKVPNAEQLVAINHFGGKILSAGAGSGKTFVLIEHIILWLDNLRIKTSVNDWPQMIPFQLPKVVLMTFTKKAAGEMSIRMMKRIDDLCDFFEGEDAGEFWEIVRQYLSMMNITTISSFCHQLLGLGYFEEIGSDIQILSKVEFKNKISNLFNLWFISKKNNLSQVFQANSVALIGAMIEIYNSPELRILWKKPLVKTSPERELDEFIEKIISELGLRALFDGGLDLNTDIKEKEKGWFIFLQSFEQLIQKNGYFSGENFREYANWAMSIGRLPVAAKAMNEDQKFSLEAVKGFVKQLRDTQEDFINFFESYDIYWSWVETFQEVYNFIDRNYFFEKGFTFSDLEYYVCTGLRNPTIREKIKKNYDYFIVDEFQDTSSVQYEIIQQLVGVDHHRIFCVGDKKQAIYGFRGGELLVFNQCSELLGNENNIWLKNNFRSEGNIIRFNNYFFKKIFPLGYGFEGADPNIILMEDQTIPENKQFTGNIEKFKTEIRNLKNDKKVDVDFYEAEALYQIIKDLLVRDDIKNVCVLYRKLKPSALLLDLLAENEVAFSAQVKVKYAEDPIINLFLRSIELKLNEKDPLKLSSTHFLMNSLLEVLNIQIAAVDFQEKFLGDLSLLGPRLAFHKLIYSFGLSNSQYQENSKLIDSICKVCKEDLVSIFHLLSSEGEETYSLQLMNGAKEKRVTIMSAHASKGLEFDAVLLGGIHSNGIQMGKTDTIGKFPKSFRWKKGYNQKKFFKSPTYYLEADIDKAKEFSESKRLLYVACTRAIRYLGWVDLWGIIEGEEKSFSSGSNHWIKAMRTVSDDQGLITEKTIQLNSKLIQKEFEIAVILKDSLGLVPISNSGKLGIFSDTSVTKLAQLVQCPFKFYLSNICKITPPKLPPKKFMNMGEGEEEVIENEEELFYSSMERGTHVHKELSRLLIGEIKLQDAEFSEREKFSWVLAESDKVCVGKNVISEKQIKFSFFGQMISGIPDVVFENAQEIIVWDFKTGTRDDLNEDSYWFQLMCYGYAYANLKSFSQEKIIQLSLLYVDQKEIVTKLLTLAQISTLLFDKWSKTESLNQVNVKHCNSCDFSSICVHYESSAY